MEIIARGVLHREAVSMNSDLTNCYCILFKITNHTISKWNSASPIGPKQLLSRARNYHSGRRIYRASVTTVLLLDHWGN